MRVDRPMSSSGSSSSEQSPGKRVCVGWFMPVLVGPHMTEPACTVPHIASPFPPRLAPGSVVGSAILRRARRRTSVANPNTKHSSRLGIPARLIRAQASSSSNARANRMTGWAEASRACLFFSVLFFAPLEPYFLCSCLSLRPTSY